MEMQPNDLGGSNMFKLKDLFEKSPFVSMVEHIEKVSLCLDELEVLLQAVKKKDYATVDKITKTISNYEAEADSIKEEVRKILGGNFYIPFDKNEIMAIVSAQDGVANISKDIANVLFFFEVCKRLLIFHQIIFVQLHWLPSDYSNLL